MLAWAIFPPIPVHLCPYCFVCDNRLWHLSFWVSGFILLLLLPPLPPFTSLVLPFVLPITQMIFTVVVVAATTSTHPY